jgi:hypothetical protein
VQGGVFLRKTPLEFLGFQAQQFRKMLYPKNSIAFCGPAMAKWLA